MPRRVARALHCPNGALQLGPIAEGEFVRRQGQALVGSAAGASSWGDITGTLSDQTDLQGVLDGKEDVGASAAAVGAHEAASDPHPEYLMFAEADLVFAAKDHTHPGGGAVVKSGTVNLTAGGTANVTFTTPFASVPVVTITPQFANIDTSCTYSARNITVNGFTAGGAGNPAGVVGWIATNAGNA